MSAVPESFDSQHAAVDAEALKPLPNSSKIHVTGSRDDIRVPMREIQQSPTHEAGGTRENPPLTVYDTSGPYTDPAARIDIRLFPTPTSANLRWHV